MSVTNQKSYQSRKMQLDADSIREFQELWKKEIGADLSEDEAREHAENLLGLVAIVYDINKPKTRKI